MKNVGAHRHPKPKISLREKSPSADWGGDVFVPTTVRADFSRSLLYPQAQVVNGEKDEKYKGLYGDFTTRF